MPKKSQQPKLMTEDEREALATFFEKKADELRKVLNGCEGMRTAYPRLAENGLFVIVYVSARDGVENARELVRYIRVATDEQWQEEL